VREKKFKKKDEIAVAYEQEKKEQTKIFARTCTQKKRIIRFGHERQKNINIK
jgi:hypothetical protein